MIVYTGDTLLYFALESIMSSRITRRTFAWASGIGTAAAMSLQQNSIGSEPPSGPTEASFERDYAPPDFKPSWKNEQLNRTMVQDFVIYAHSDLDQVKMLLQKQPKLLNGAIDWGNGDWETALGGASHMGRRDIVTYLLEQGARIDLFCATMLGMLEVVKSMLEFQPGLIDAKGPHGFSLHFHAQVGGENSQAVLDYLQTIKQVELKPVPFLNTKPKG